ncbi:glycosyltransferase family A protein [Stenotrophomonas sp. CFBP 13725]|uniref:glycosyltransferase family 2 protein n=1 Tax=Stenotrophomonas sp. CFBP 13725 TaxID=2775297 RepID=UPI001784BF08|nr:glycosyltransferase family A protein [Stenotrophomonas sp. CFBP 13725]MBD8637302.1 glycosyltransferase family 2 protein [Stenotrophomonas sp. CFBP 13725]
MTTRDPTRAAELVSVVIPLFNRKDTILRAVQSALEQDHGNIEVVVVDDGSTDDPTSILDRAGDSRIRYFRQANSGACAARNHGIDVSRGEYVAFLDSDDTFLPGHLTASLAVLRATTESTVVYGKIRVDRGEERYFTKPPRARRQNEPISEYLLCDRGFIQTSTVVLPRQLAAKIRYKVGLRFGQDTDFAIRLAAAGAEFVMLDSIQAQWTDHAQAGRVSNALDAAARLEWLDSVSSSITRRARLGDEGWYVAKSHFKRGEPLKAAWLYARAVACGCYSPTLAMRIGAQIFLSTATYRKIADLTLKPR